MKRKRTKEGVLQQVQFRNRLQKMFSYGKAAEFFKYIRKVPEMYYTMMIEVVWGKERILEVYLNEAEMGKGVFGIEAAAKAHFNKTAKTLTDVEAAKIISTLPNPKVYTIEPMHRWVRFRHRGILRQMQNIKGDPDIQKLMGIAVRPAIKKKTR